MATEPIHPSFSTGPNSHLGGVLICLLIALLPTTMMTELRGGSANFWGLLAISLIVCFAQPGGVSTTIDRLRSYKVLIVAYLAFPVTVVLAMLWSQEILEGDIERSVRIFGGTVAILAASLSINPAWLRQSMWGLMAGVIGGTGTLVWASWPHFTRPHMDQYTTVGYSNALLLLTILVLFSLGWQLTRFKKTEHLLKITIVLIGMLGVIIADTRSSWLAIPFFILIGLILIRKSVTVWRLILTGIVAIALATGAFFANPSLAARAKLAVKEYVDCRTTTPLADTSVCIRLQLWRASWHMFKANPILANAGASKFEEKLAQLHKQGVVSEFTSKDFGETHNDLFHALANYGLLGFISFLLIYFAPAWIFAQRLSARFSSETRVAAAMGLAVCAGFVAFGLTEAMFRSMRMLSFYAVLIAWLLALSHTSDKKIHPL